MRQIVVDETKEPAYAIPYSDRQQAFEKYKELLLDYLTAFSVYDEEDEEYQDIAEATSEDELGSWPSDGPVLLLEEGDPGVWTGFSSSDRNALGGPLPLPSGFIGNGDPNLYLTVGRPDGEQVPMTPSVNGEETHPLYQAHLIACGDAEDEDDY